LEAQDLVLDLMHLAQGILPPYSFLLPLASSIQFLSVKTCYNDFFWNSFCRLPSNITDPMGDRMPPPNAWRPMHPPNMGPSTNAGLHGMGPPMLPRSGEMALPTNAVSTIFYSP